MATYFIETFLTHINHTSDNCLHFERTIVAVKLRPKFHLPQIVHVATKYEVRPNDRMFLEPTIIVRPMLYRVATSVRLMTVRQPVLTTELLQRLYMF